MELANAPGHLTCQRRAFMPRQPGSIGGGPERNIVALLALLIDHMKINT